MSRYRVEEASAVSIARNIYGPGRLTLGYIYGPWKPEAERFKRFIEAHDEILTVLRGAKHALGPKDRYTPIIEKLINRIEGEEAQ